MQRRVRNSGFRGPGVTLAIPRHRDWHLETFIKDNIHPDASILLLEGDSESALLQIKQILKAKGLKERRKAGAPEISHVQVDTGSHHARKATRDLLNQFEDDSFDLVLLYWMGGAIDDLLEEVRRVSRKYVVVQELAPLSPALSILGAVELDMPLSNSKEPARLCIVDVSTMPFGMPPEGPSVHDSEPPPYEPPKDLSKPARPLSPEEKKLMTDAFADNPKALEIIAAQPTEPQPKKLNSFGEPTQREPRELNALEKISRKVQLEFDSQFCKAVDEGDLLRKAAKLLASEHMHGDLLMHKVYLLPHPNEIRVIAITESVPDRGEVLPFRFSADPPDIPFKQLIILLHPNEWERRDKLDWPKVIDPAWNVLELIAERVAILDPPSLLGVPMAKDDAPSNDLIDKAASMALKNYDLDVPPKQPGESSSEFGTRVYEALEELLKSKGVEEAVARALTEEQRAIVKDQLGLSDEYDIQGITCARGEEGGLIIIDEVDRTRNKAPSAFWDDIENVGFHNPEEEQDDET